MRLKVVNSQQLKTQQFKNILHEIFYRYSKPRAN
jgi:hypothetical protein